MRGMRRHEGKKSGRSARRCEVISFMRRVFAVMQRDCMAR
jgi:hypothetical protein